MKISKIRWVAIVICLFVIGSLGKIRAISETPTETPGVIEGVIEIAGEENAWIRERYAGLIEVGSPEIRPFEVVINGNDHCGIPDKIIFASTEEICLIPGEDSNEWQIVTPTPTLDIWGTIGTNYSTPTPEPKIAVGTFAKWTGEEWAVLEKRVEDSWDSLDFCSGCYSLKPIGTYILYKCETCRQADGWYRFK